MRSRAGATALLTAAAPLLAAALLVSPARAQDPTDMAQARELFVQGGALAEQGRWEEARQKFERSLKLKRASLTLYSLGVAERQTGRLIEARESFVAFLAEPSTPASRPFEKPAREAIAELDRRIASVRFEVIPSGVAELTVELDGVLVSSSELAQVRPVNPGAHRVTASAPGYKPLEMRLTAGEGETVTAKVALEPSAPPHLTPGAGGGYGMEKVVPVVLVGSGLATFTAGLAVGLGGVIDSGAASTKDGPEASAARSKALVGDIVGGVGLAAAGVGVVLLIVQAASSPKAPVATPSSTLRIEPHATGVRVRF